MKIKTTSRAAHSHASGPIDDFIQRDFPLVYLKETANEVFAKIRNDGIKQKIIYLYVVDDSKQLLGVLPVHRLLTADTSASVESLYLKRCISLKTQTSLDEARQSFSEHRYLAFPVVDKENRFLGVLSIEQFAGDLGDISAVEKKDALFELFGLHTGGKAIHSPLAMLKIRLPWLAATFFTGIMAAFVTEHFQVTLHEAVIVSFFLTLVLGLNESVAMQSTTLTVSRFHKLKPDFSNLLKALGNEFLCAFPLGASYGSAAMAVVLLWQRQIYFAAALGLSLCLSMTISCLWGVAIPFLLHRTQRDPKVASGPLVLGLCDLSTLFIYFMLAKFFLLVIQPQ